MGTPLEGARETSKSQTITITVAITNVDIIFLVFRIFISLGIRCDKSAVRGTQRTRYAAFHVSVQVAIDMNRWLAHLLASQFGVLLTLLLHESQPVPPCPCNFQLNATLSAKLLPKPQECTMYPGCSFVVLVSPSLYAPYVDVN